jgi:hypothetical protein
LGLGGRNRHDADPLQASGPVYVDPVAGVVGAGPGVQWRPLDVPENDRSVYIVNYAALNALRAITGADFGLNKRAWRNWWAEHRDDGEIWKRVKE